MIAKLGRFITSSVSDSFGLAKCSGPGFAIKWLFKIGTNLRECVKQSNFQPADLAMGEGPFPVSRKHAKAKLSGDKVFSGIREIWVRDVYLQDDYLTIASDATVVDLGANMGNFSMLALAHGDNVHVVSVEPCLSLITQVEKQAALNGWSDRLTTYRGFLGGFRKEQKMLLEDTDCEGVPFCPVEDFIAQHELDSIDYLKCDIEGSEFELLTPDSPLLAMSKQIAIEIHYPDGDKDELLSIFRNAGFEIGPVKYDPNCCTVLAKKPT